MIRIEPLTELDLLMSANSKKVSDLLVEIGVLFAIQRKSGRDVRQAMKNALANLGDLFRKSQGLADMLGRKRVMLEVAKVQNSRNQNNPNKPGTQTFAQTPSPHNFTLDFASDVPFEEALDSIIDAKVFGGTQKQTLEELRRVYGNPRTVQAFPGVAEAQEALFGKVNQILARQIQGGLPTQDAIREITQSLQEWSDSKGQLVHRTQTAKAYTAGRWRQLEQPGVKRRIGGVQFIATRDSSVRSSHLALNKLIFAPNDSIWSEISPPVHFNCRCSIRFLSFQQMGRMGRLDVTQTSSFFPLGLPVFDPHPTSLPEPRFGQRADKTVYSFAS